MSLLPSLLLRFLSFAVLWWILAEGVIFDVWFILAAVLAVTVASYRVFPTGGSWHFRLLPLLAFVPFFIWHSVLGGLDVARRALHPNMPLDPGFLEYPLSCSGKTRFLLAWVVSLLPGTASVALDGEILRVHLLDRGLRNQERIRGLEVRLCRIDQGSGGMRVE